MENDDPYFGQWIENRLDSTMGKQPATHGTKGELGVVAQAHGPAQFAAELDKGVAMGLHALGSFKSRSLTQGGGADNDSKKGYGEGTLPLLWVSPM